MLRSLKSFVVSSSVFLFLMGFCAGGDDIGDYETSLFAPEIANTPVLQPFFKSYSQFYRGNDINNDEKSYYGKNSTPNFREQNSKDWAGFFENKLDTSAINQMLYRSNIGEVDKLIFHIKERDSVLNPELKDSKILTFENKEKSLEFLYYLGFALRAETFTNRPNIDWDYKAVSFKGNEFLAKLIKGGQRQAINSKSMFVKERYHFQNIRLHYFNEDYKACELYFEINKNDFQKNGLIYYRSLGYVAAGFYKQKNYAKANYYYARLFENVPMMKKMAMWSFHPQQEADWQKSLALAQNANEKATLWFMMGYNQDNLRAMQQIVKLVPNSPYLDALLTRAINTNEYDVLQDIYKNPTAAFKSSKTDAKLLAFVTTQTGQNKTIWNLGAGYLNLLKGDLNKAEGYFKKVESKDSLVTESLKLYRSIAHVQSYEKLGSKDENDLLEDMNRIQKSNKYRTLRTESARIWLHKRMATLYKKQGELIKAECWTNHSTPYFYENIANLESVEAFLSKSNKSKYEQLLQSMYDYNKQNILEAQVVIWTYKGNIGKASEILKKERLSGQSFLGDPFVIHINDCHDCDHAAFTKSKKEAITDSLFLAKLLNYQETAATTTNPETKADAYFNMANGFYNITYFGNGRSFYETPLLSRDYLSSFEYKNYYNGENLKSNVFDCGVAASYYQKALEATKDPERKAKFAFMLAKCEQNQFFLRKPKNYKGSFKAGTQFASLKTNYAKTKYYQEILKECGYFRTYIKH